jgi:excisionase family DNA binding protein
MSAVRDTSPASTTIALSSEQPIELLHRLLAAVNEVRAVILGARKDYYTVADVAQLTGRSAYTVRRWITERRLEATRVHGTGPRGRLLIPGAQIQRLLANGLAADGPAPGAPAGTGSAAGTSEGAGVSQRALMKLISS